MLNQILASVELAHGVGYLINGHKIHSLDQLADQIMYQIINIYEKRSLILTKKRTRIISDQCLYISNQYGSSVGSPRIVRSWVQPRTSSDQDLKKKVVTVPSPSTRYLEILEMKVTGSLKNQCQVSWQA